MLQTKFLKNRLFLTVFAKKIDLKSKFQLDRGSHENYLCVE